jgi:hypothetical protein
MVSASSANQSRPSSAGDQTPTLLSQPPRLVLELTSGLSVTTRAPTSGASRVRSISARPSAACVVVVPLGVRPKSPGTSLTVTGVGGVRRSRRAVRSHRAAAALSDAKPCHGWSTSAPTPSASTRICSAVSSEEWFCGWPSVARP